MQRAGASSYHSLKRPSLRVRVAVLAITKTCYEARPESICAYSIRLHHPSHTRQCSFTDSMAFDLGLLGFQAVLDQPERYSLHSKRLTVAVSSSRRFTPSPARTALSAMTLAATVYAKQLFYRGHGLPMWIPEPSEFGTVQIGDVGYVVDGCFYRLFNATKPADHSLNCNGVPASYEPLVFKPSLVHRVNDYLPPGPLCSRSVRDAEIRIGIAACVLCSCLGGQHLTYR